MKKDLDWLRNTEINYYRKLHSSNKIFAPLVIFVKRILRKLFKFIGVPMVDEINEYLAAC